MTRREFMETAAIAAAGSAFGAAKPAEPRLCGCLLHPDKPHISKIRKGTDQIADARERYYGA